MLHILIFSKGRFYELSSPLLNNSGKSSVNIVYLFVSFWRLQKTNFVNFSKFTHYLLLIANAEMYRNAFSSIYIKTPTSSGDLGGHDLTSEIIIYMFFTHSFLLSQNRVAYRKSASWDPRSGWKAIHWEEEERKNKSVLTMANTFANTTMGGACKPPGLKYDVGN